MGYAKTILYGNNIERYEYEYNLRPSDKSQPRKPRKKICDVLKWAKREDNIHKRKADFRRLVAANLTDEKPLFISFTYKENMGDIKIAYKDYRLFVQAMRYRFGKGFRYIAVPEFQDRGAVHFHTLFWGLPQEINQVSERENRTIFNMWEKGFVDIVQTDGHEKLSSYLAKYMAKAFVDRRLRNQKGYVASRNIIRPVTTTMITPYLYLHFDEKATPVLDEKYNTKYLGECRHTLYKIED